MKKTMIFLSAFVLISSSASASDGNNNKYDNYGVPIDNQVVQNDSGVKKANEGDSTLTVAPSNPTTISSSRKYNNFGDSSQSVTAKTYQACYTPGGMKISPSGEALGCDSSKTWRPIVGSCNADSEGYIKAVGNGYKKCTSGQWSNFYFSLTCNTNSVGILKSAGGGKISQCNGVSWVALEVKSASSDLTDPSVCIAGMKGMTKGYVMATKYVLHGASYMAPDYHMVCNGKKWEKVIVWRSRQRRRKSYSTSKLELNISNILITA